jgi:peptidoglycan/LPS O-acetylase OafA/YrhL
MKYRSEIDGLRALAVLSVILFHAGFKAFSGGFVGVDVFFVISGFLITTIILSELEQGKFSIVKFYERRARRILPALFLVMLICIPFAWFWLLPSDMKNFSQSLIAVSIFASNILFWQESGYFNTAAELKPLLHTWSLAIEEQYYILFPLFLMLSWKLGKRWILVTLGLLFITSFVIAEWLVYSKPIAAFLLLPTRAWELLIGTFAAFYLSSSNYKGFVKARSEAAGWLGVVLILYAVFCYSKTTVFPSHNALAPTIGTVLIILFGTDKTAVGKFLGNKVLVGIGLISYSAYLWHQPFFAFAKLRYGNNELSTTIYFLLILVVFILAYLSWYLIESFFRNPNKVTSKLIFRLAIIMFLFFLVLGLIGNTDISNELRFSKDRLELVNTLDSNKRKYLNCFTDIKHDRPNVSKQDFCMVGANNTKPSFILFGDSHAISIANSVNIAASKVGLSGYLVATSSCPPLLGVDPTRKDNIGLQCMSMREEVLKVIKEESLRKVYLVGRWDYYIKNGDTDGAKMSINATTGTIVKYINEDDLLMFGIKNMVKKIESLGAKVKIFKQAPSQINDPKNLFYKKIQFSEIELRDFSVSIADLNERREQLNRKFLNEIGLNRLIEVNNYLCNAYVCPIGEKNKSFYIDTSHLSDYGSERLINMLTDELVH